MRKKISIYALINPIDNSVFYIGATLSPDSRLNDHKSEKQNRLKNRIISSIKSKGLSPELLVLDTCFGDEVRFMEDFYSDLYRSYGFKIPTTKSAYNISCSSMINYPIIYTEKSKFICSFMGIDFDIELRNIDSSLIRDVAANIFERIKKLIKDVFDLENHFFSSYYSFKIIFSLINDKWYIVRFKENF